MRDGVYGYTHRNNVYMVRIKQAVLFAGDRRSSINRGCDYEVEEEHCNRTVVMIEFDANSSVLLSHMQYIHLILTQLSHVADAQCA